MTWLTGLLSKLASTKFGQFIITWALEKFWGLVKKAFSDAYKYASLKLKAWSDSIKSAAALKKYDDALNKPEATDKDKEDAFKKFIDGTNPDPKP